MLGLAFKYGLKDASSPLSITVNGNNSVVVDKTNTNSSYLGPLLGVNNTDNYQLAIKGQGKYVLANRNLGSGSVPAEIQTDIDREVDAILDAGHLKPSVFQVAVPGSGAQGRGNIYWYNPGEIHYFLSEVYPLLNDARKTRVLSYLQSERTNFPPENARALPYWGSGTFREADPPSTHTYSLWWYGDTDETHFAYMKFKTQGDAVIWNLYGLARFYQLTNTTPTSTVQTKVNTIVTNGIQHADWASLYWQNGYWPEFNAVHGVNQLFSGFVGYIRLARLSQNTAAENIGWGMLAKMAILRHSMGKYTQYLYDTGRFTFPQNTPLWQANERQDNVSEACCPGGDLITFNFTQAIHNTNQIHRLDDRAVWVSDWFGSGAGVQGTNPDEAMNGTGQDKARGPSDGSDWNELGWHSVLSPYLLPFADLTPELGRFLKDTLSAEVTIYSDRIAENQPHWFTAYSDAMVSYENGYMTPMDSYGNFLAHAWVRNTPNTSLAKYVDYSWVKTGDLYYLHKLAEAAKAYKGWSWSDGPGPTPPTATPTPDVDYDNNNIVDYRDFLYVVTHFGQSLNIFNFNQLVELIF